MSDILEQQINFYRPEFGNPRSLFDLPGLLQLTAIIAGGMLLLYGWSLWQSHLLEQERVQMQSWLDERRQQLTAASGADQNGDRQRLLREFQQLERQRLQNGQTIRLLRQASQEHRYGIADFMESLSRKVPRGLWLTRFSIDGERNAILIHGQASKPELVPHFIERLSEEETLKGVHFAQLAIENNRDDRRWVDFTLRSDIDKE